MSSERESVEVPYVFVCDLCGDRYENGVKVHPHSSARVEEAKADLREAIISEIEKLRDRKYRTPRGMRYALNGRDRVLLDYVIQNMVGSVTDAAQEHADATDRSEAP